MSSLSVYDTTIRGESKGLQTFLESRFILTEIIQALSTILMKDGATRVGPFAKLEDLQGLGKVTGRLKGLLFFDD